MSIRNYKIEAENYLSDKFAKLKSKTKSGESTCFFVPKLGAQESKYFILGLEHNFYSIDEEGYVKSSILPPPTKPGDKQRMITLYWHRQGKRYLYREGVCQLSTVTYLILNRGWNKDSIFLEPDISNYGDLAYAVDIIIKASQGKILVCCEVKKSKSELDKLIKHFKYCSNIGPHERKSCKYRQNHPKYEMCAKYEPMYFYVTAPDNEICYKLSYNNGRIFSEELWDLPHKNQISFQG